MSSQLPVHGVFFSAVELCPRGDTENKKQNQRNEGGQRK